jgi:hypothetical protein
MAEKHHEWLVWPKDSRTNEAIARMAENGDNRFEEGTLTDALCEDGKRRNFWIMSELNARFLYNSDGLKLEIFNRLGGGKIRKVTFLFRPKRKKKARHGRF